MKVRDLIMVLHNTPMDADIMLMVPDESGKKGHVQSFRAESARVSTNAASTMPQWSEKILIIESTKPDGPRPEPRRHPSSPGWGVCH